MLTQLTLAGLETAINQTIQLDPDTPPRIAKLVGNVVAIELKGLAIKFFVKFTEAGVKLMENCEDEVNTTIKGTPFALAKMGMTNDAKSLFSGDVEMSGDMECGQAVKDIFDNMHIDWEEHLSAITGDELAHLAGNFARTTRDWTIDTANAMQQNLTEYLQEEKQQLPPREEIEDFYKDIDTLRTDTDRLEARINRLK